MERFEEFLKAYTKTINNEIFRWNLKPHDKEDAFQAIALKLYQSYESILKKAVVTSNPEAYTIGAIKRAAKQEIMEEIVGYSHLHKDQKNLAAKMRDASFMVGTMSAEPDEDSYGDWYNATGSVPSAEAVAIAAMTAFDPWPYIDKLSERQRTCMTLKYFNELTVAEIVEKTGHSPKKVQAALSHGMRNIRIMMGVEYAGKRGAPRGAKVGVKRESVPS